ncbi:MAG: hypothetical protein KZQ90_20830 [Candidatus Thiodiazotropha sp. (ex Codakia rugifera)]|nr:hypothetical protein [Candidatus Thiodiazotropha sp. (ex Codakia rugifera)]
MEYPELFPILENLVNKYRVVTYDEWKNQVENGERFNDYSEDDSESEFFWQAHTNVLEFETNESGNYAHISISIYSENVHSVPPAPNAGMLVYESGWCDVGTPEREYIYDQKIQSEINTT